MSLTDEKEEECKRLIDEWHAHLHRLVPSLKDSDCEAFRDVTERMVEARIALAIIANVERELDG